ncbi:MAG TPA: thioredoxin domain-containing protein [Anaeromyxobacteraceae bacterium]|nr:thioredoxin domain-containing protein [Anaeromyxobacteraceae bacterium]
MIETPPGAAPFPAPLAERLGAAVAARGPEWRPRTRHQEAGRPRFANRLALETSPYLLQHAHNPVNWYPWGDEAFEEARRTGRPVFLSVGYSTCHWCHVMEEESFEDLEVARLLNERYVAIKVDREERPDVDAVYMTATQALTGGGGWPMSVWLDLERRPFFAGTYLPARDGDRGASRGFLSIAREVADVWSRDPGRVGAAASALAAAVRVALGAGEPAPAGAPLPGAAAIEKAVAGWARSFDERHGGLRGAPKFPSSLPVRLLLRHHRRTRDPRSLEMAALTLERMAAGGMHDQLAGGFHRYSTDERWLVPHFEKMLYDNALLAVAYAEAWQATRRPDFARVVRTTLDYLLRDMAAPGGGFFSATDADSEGVEGKYFVWSEKEIRERLGPEADRLAAFYGVTAEGNFEGANILHVPRADEKEWEALAGARAALLEARSRRVPPLRDEKLLAAWNGLAISALAVGGRVLGEPRWVEAAHSAAGFVLAGMRRDGRLLRSWTAGRAAPVPGFLEDHAFLVQGLIDLYEATFEVRWLREALDLAEATERLFADREGGGWFASAEDHERLIARQKPTHDGAEPSGASVAVLNALRLLAFTADDRWRLVAERALRAHATTLAEHPQALHDMLLGVDFHGDAVREVVLVWPAGEPAPEPFLRVLRQTFLPSRALAGAPEGPALAALGQVALVARDKKAAGGRPTAYVCEKGACRLPAIEPEKLRAQVEPVKPLR